GQGALFGSAITTPTNVSVTTAVSLGSINFNNANKYTLTNGGGSLTMQTYDPAGAQMNVLSGSHEIDVPVTLQSNTTVNVAANSTLLVNNTVSASGVILQTASTSAGTFAMASFNVPTLSIQGGTIKLAGTRNPANTGVVTGTITIGASAKLDLGSN